MQIIRTLIYALFYPVLLTGTVTYVIQNFLGKADPPSFEFALVSAVMGGFALSDGFLKDASSRLRRNVKCIGSFYLGAAIAFITFGLVLPVLKMETSGITYWIVFLSGMTSMFSGIAFFVFASGFLIAELPTILKEFWP